MLAGHELTKRSHDTIDWFLNSAETRTYAPGDTISLNSLKAMNFLLSWRAKLKHRWL